MPCIQHQLVNIIMTEVLLDTPLRILIFRGDYVNK